MKHQIQPEQTADNGSNEPMKERLLKIEAQLPHPATGQDLNTALHACRQELNETVATLHSDMNEQFKVMAGRQTELDAIMSAPDARMSLPLWMYPLTLTCMTAAMLAVITLN